MRNKKAPKQVKDAATASTKKSEDSTPKVESAEKPRSTRSKPPPKPLSPEEKKTLEASEQIIRQNLNDSWALAKALRDIREARLYRETSLTFKEYCLKTWKLSHCRARQLINALVVREHLGQACGTEKLPETECQVRPLTHLGKKPALQVKAWKSACDEAKGQPTGAQVKQAVPAFATPEPRRSREAKVARLLRSLTSALKDAAGVDKTLASILDAAATRATELQKANQRNPGKDGKSRA